MQHDDRNAPALVPAEEAANRETVPTPQPWNFLWTVLLTFLTIIIAYGSSFLVIRYVYHLQAGSHPGLSFQNFAKTLITNGQAIGLSTIATGLIGSLCVFFLVWVKKNGPSLQGYLGLKNARVRDYLFWLGILFVFSITAGLLGQALGESEKSSQFAMGLFKSGDHFWLLVIAVCIAAPIFEELLIRGFFLEGLRHSFVGTTGAVLVSSLLWTIMHTQYAWFNLMLLGIMGILLGTAKIMTRSLYVPIFLHIVHNSVAVTSVIFILQNQTAG